MDSHVCVAFSRAGELLGSRDRCGWSAEGSAALSLPFRPSVLKSDHWPRLSQTTLMTMPISVSAPCSPSPPVGFTHSAHTTLPYPEVFVGINSPSRLQQWDEVPCPLSDCSGVPCIGSDWTKTEPLLSAEEGHKQSLL